MASRIGLFILNRSNLYLPLLCRRHPFQAATHDAGLVGHGVYAVFVEVHRVGLAARLGMGFPETAARHESFALMAVALQEVGVDLVGKSLDEGPEVAVAGHVLSQFARGEVSESGGVAGFTRCRLFDLYLLANV